ncbi:MAG: hypothetical protein AB7Q42_22495 [Acidimicrobiia bacterium]
MACVGGAARRAAIAATALVLVGACSGDDGPGSGGGAAAAVTSVGPRTAPLTPDDPNRISAAEATAIVRLGEVATGDVPSAGGHAHGHNDPGPQATFVLTEEHQAAFDEQWRAATDAAESLDTPAAATSAGYVVAAVPGPGVGTHWVKWSLIDAPFDAANPAMLLFDGVGDEAELVGFSYWLRSEGGPPKGFAGPNDTWHQHTGLCVVNGWVDREMSAGPEACAGTFLGGADLWMLHAWVVPDWANRWGDFAVMNPSLCPAIEGTPELARCPAEFVL